MPYLVSRACLIATLAGAVAPAAAQDAAAAWRQLTMGDVEFAHRLLAENHPGAAPEVGDTAFVRMLAEGRAAALEQATRVRDRNGYVAVMNGLAYAMADKHIWMNPTQQSKAFRWAGAVTSLRGGNWVITGGDSTGGFATPIGATLVSCDGIAIADLARQRLGSTRAVWSVEAQQIAAAPLLLVDDGNPFVPLPAQCIVRRAGVEEAWSLTWRPVSRAALGPLLAPAAPLGAPGFGVRRVGDGTWIAMQSLNTNAAAVVDTVRAMGAALRAAPTIVVDLRGNGGGNSQYGTELAELIWGEPHVRAVSRMLGGGGEACTTVFRASPGNLEAWSALVDRLRAQGNEQGVASFGPAVEQMREAIAAGRAMSGPVCPPSERPASLATGERPAIPADIAALSQYAGRVVLLTDHACFSSCLLVTELFRALGAVHVGEATDAATHYMEVREAELPSGLGKFSTLQKVSLGVPRAIGPYRPDHAFSGSIDDTAALERWVAGGFAAP